MSTTAIQGGIKSAARDWRASLSPTVITLGALLALQLLVALVLEIGGRGMEPAGSQGPLLAFDRDKVTGIRIQAPDGEPVLVTKTEGHWIIPSLGDLPAAEHKVTGLLSKLADLKKGLPVATSEEALKRFKVSDQVFERKLTLESEEAAPAILYLGDSPGFRRLFVRTDGDSAVYDAELGLFDAPDKASDWSDRTLLHLDTEKLQRLAFSGVILERKDDSWQLADLAEGEEQDEQAIEDKVRALANIDFLGVLTDKGEPEVDKEATPVEIEATLANGETLHYRIVKLAEGNDYLLEVSNRPQRFTLASYVAENLTGTSRARLLKASEEAVESPSEESPPDEAVGSESGSAEPTGQTPISPQGSEQDAAGAGSPDPEDTSTPAPK